MRTLFIDSYKLLKKAQARLDAMDPDEPVPSPFLFVLPTDQTMWTPSDKQQQIGATVVSVPESAAKSEQKERINDLEELISGNNEV